MPSFFSLARHHLDDLGIVAGQDRGQRLDDGDLRAQLGVERADLDADVAAADHDEPLGDGVERERAGRIDDAVAVELEARDLDRARAGRDHDVVGLDRHLPLASVSSTVLRDTRRATPVR